MLTVNIVSRSTRVGIDRDAALLREELERAGAQVRDVHARADNAYLERLRWLLPAPGRRRGKVRPADVNLTLEKAYYRWCWLAERNFLIPNQEWFAPRLARGLDRFERVYCKTRHALEIFQDLGARTELLGFTSVDRLAHDIEPDYRRFLHVAGRSRLKGTETLVELWRRHPEWPLLVVLQSERQVAVEPAPNLEIRQDFVSDRELQHLQNRSGIHLCPSSAEGWGHSIVEGASCRAVVVTTDGPPMNELVRPDRGVLVPWSHSTPRKLGTDYFVDPEALETALQQLIDGPTAPLVELGRRARGWFETNDDAFRQRLRAVLREWGLTPPSITVTAPI